MKLQINKKYLGIGLTAFLVIAASICFYYLVFHGDRFSAHLHSLFRILSPIIYGIIFAYLMTPMVNGMEKFLKEKINISSRQKKYLRFFSVFFTLLIVILLIYGFFSILIPDILKSIRSISYQFPYYMQNLSVWAARFLEDNPDIEAIVLRFLDTYSEEFLDYVNNSIVPQMETVVRQVSLSLISVLKFLWNFIIGMIISIYVLFSKERFAGQGKKIIFALFSTKTANQIIRDIRFVSNTFIRFISGKIIDSIVIGILCFIGTSLMEIPYALLISVIVGVTNIIPFFGPYLGAVPSAILILMVNPLKCLYFIVFIFVLQQIDGNFIDPKISGQSTGLSGFWVIFSITVFGGILGIPGMIIGVPFFAVFYAMIKRMTSRMLQKKGLPQETGKYMDVDYIQEDRVFVPKTELHKEPGVLFSLYQRMTKKQAEHKEDSSKGESSRR